MKFKKVLVLFTDMMDKAVISEIVQFCRKFKSKLYVLFVLEPKKISRLSSITHRAYDALHKEIEEQGWQLLYLVEDEAVQNNVWTSLHLEEAVIASAVKKFIEAYAIDCIMVRRSDETKKLFLSCSVPVIGL
jgi:hypothetical protein